MITSDKPRTKELFIDQVAFLSSIARKQRQEGGMDGRRWVLHVYFLKLVLKETSWHLVQVCPGFL